MALPHVTCVLLVVSSFCSSPPSHPLHYSFSYLRKDTPILSTLPLLPSHTTGGQKWKKVQLIMYIYEPGNDFKS